MPWSNNPPFSIDDAVARGDDVYEVIFDSWGFRSFATPTTDYSNLQWPPASDNSPPVAALSLPRALAGIAIGPQSTVDRCWVGYNLGKSQTMPSPAFLLTDRIRRLSVDSPLIFTQAAAPGTKNAPGSPDNPIFTQATKGSLYIYPMADDFGSGNPITFDYPNYQETTVLPQTFTPASGGAPIDMDGIPPRLHLYLYLKAPVAYVPTKRFPLQVQGTAGAGETPIQPGAERLIAQIPTFGRKRVHIMMMSSQIADFRIGALRAIGQITALQEQPVDQATAIPANTPTILGPCAHAGEADYTNLYATVSAPATVLFQVTAYD